jgi:uroporphyrinogen III methyltransferase/synthase
MGVGRLPRIAAALMAGGRSPDEPAAVVERGTLPGQRAALATLSTIADRVGAEGLRPPAVTVVGPVAALRERLAWLEERPLHGRTAAVTRARAQASGLAARLRVLGADVVEAPAIRVEPLPATVPDLAAYDLAVFTSPNGVALLFDRMPGDARALAGATVAAIGPGTARALREHGIEADVVPERAVAESLLEALADVPVERALVARAQEARDVLPDGLRARGIEVDVLPLYRTVAEPLGGAALAAALDAYWIAFTSASTVQFFLEAAGGEPPRGRIVSIGPVTTAALRDRGLQPAIEAADHDVDGVVAAILADATGAAHRG